ncbi:hypothetical protein [Okeania sp. SIO1H2]|nr:hypothetical protein [Okeania sp. SIO1H2]
MLQIARLFLRSQPTPNPSQEGSQESGRGDFGLVRYRMNGFDIIF